MANWEQVEILRKGVQEWNAWREQNPDRAVDLSAADLRATSLGNANLRDANLSVANC